MDKKMSLLKQYTNQDQVRNMSTEELALFIFNILQCCTSEDCENCPMKAFSPCNLSDIKQWLESEAKILPQLPKLPPGGSCDKKSVMEVGFKTLIDENDGFWDIYPKDEEWTRVLKKS